jgi:hypothetical protein
MSLEEQLAADLKEAMLAGETRRRDVIRFLRAALTNARIERGRPLSDPEIEDIIRFQIKQRRDSIELFHKGGRDDLAAEETAQIEILTPYLPEQLSDDELLAIVRSTADDLNATTARDMGRLIPAVLDATAGRAEGRRVSQFAREELARRTQTSSR